MIQATFRPATINRAGRQRIEQIQSLAKEFLPGRVIDLGCGTGEIGLSLIPLGAVVTFADRTAVRILPAARHRFIMRNAEDIDLGEFDLIVCAGLLYHMNLSDQLRLAENMFGKPVILDTHFSRRPDVFRGAYSGQFRTPTWSTANNRPFVHSIASLRAVFLNHDLTEPMPKLSDDRKVMLLTPKSERADDIAG